MEYQIFVSPRFGVESLYPMFEEIFSYNIHDNKSEQETKYVWKDIEELLSLDRCAKDSNSLYLHP